MWKFILMKLKKLKATYSQVLVTITTETPPALKHAAGCKQQGRHCKEKAKRTWRYTS
jgi:hypothetical protein